ncbi:M81 family metallopeptidase [Orrella daihaiensis]|uniref:M81 family metallopeptidase n=1 Tax=Orrella daihaiensis TaxID=2782176 RepID=A0ABY4AKB6_9BURK|nr:M81 family metallopeptidase [Orrella daihaiensis]UOD50713.1 M81 family metallopeptidase [Orrella daihaiensis]
MKSDRKPWRIALAGFHLESASFLPQISTLEDFETGTTRGDDILQAYRDTNTVMGGFIHVCEQCEVKMVPLVYSFLGALGPASDEAVQAFADEISLGVAKQTVDGVLLHLHGACWAQGFEDVERYFIERLRQQVGTDLPVVVAFDYHGNLDHASIAQLDAAYAYRLSPHTDMGQTGERAARGLMRILETGQRPGMAIEKPGLIVPSIFSATALEPLASIIKAARTKEVELDATVDISIMAGFSYADSHNTGFSVIVVSEHGQAHAQSLASAFSDLIKKQRAELYAPEPVLKVDEAIPIALEISPKTGHPVVLLEHADRINDSSYVLNALLDHQAPSAYVPFLLDPAAANLANEAGVGAEVDIELGGWSSDRAGARRTHRATVLQCGPKSYKVSGQMMQGQHVDLGMTALVQIGHVYVSVVSKYAFTVDEDVYKVFGLSINDFDMVVLRSKTHFRQFFEKVATRIIIVDTPDYGPADLMTIPYARLNTANVYPHSEV